MKAEAAQRLEAAEAIWSTSLADIVDDESVADVVLDHAYTLAEWTKEQDRLAQTPVSVEGLVAMGDLWQPGRSTHLCNRVFLDLPEARIVVEFWGDGQIVWMVNGHSVHSMFAPDNMLRVHDLIERLSR